ncbi:hypothetical protein [Halobacterium zhouii]|uniref:hypothetical protein n=1 Tax=Halobacterium zhouii TaxID=2902624 RepID=UPI001E5D73A1|nr:hypothetical protein [Halobacterium zhouii]
MTQSSHSAHWERVRALAEESRRDRESFDPPTEPPDEEQAKRYLVEGVGPAVSVYVEGRTGGSNAAFSDVELSLLERAMNDWLTLYTRCYGVELDADFSIREAATALLDTRNVVDTAQVLTRVPERGGS